MSSVAAEAAPSYVSLLPGDPAPWFRQRSTSNPRHVFDTAAGRYIVLGFFATAGDPVGKATVDWLTENRALFDDERITFFGVSVDPQDEASGRVAAMTPGIRHFWDFDGEVSRLYGAAPGNAEPGASGVAYRRMWVVLDPTLRVVAVLPFTPDGGDRPRLADFLQRLPDPSRFAGVELQAPILYLPNVFEPAATSSASTNSMAARNRASCARSTAAPSSSTTPPTRSARTIRSRTRR